MKKIILALFALPLFAQDGGITGEATPAAPSVVQRAALGVREIHSQWVQQSVRTLELSVRTIKDAGDVAFWQRLGTKGKRTLRWLNDILQTTDAAATQAGVEPVSQGIRDTLAKWTANPDNTVTVSP